MGVISKVNEKINRYYNLDGILKTNALYNMIIGERSNGKSYAVKEYILKEYCQKGSQGVVIRRYGDDFKKNGGSTYWNDIVDNGLIAKYSNGEWEGITYKSFKWYFHKFDEITQTKKLSDDPFAYAICLTDMERTKSQSYPKVKNVLFEEFITRSTYLVDEFIIFSNVLSTIIRDRDDVKIFMLANTVNKFCPYFKEMGLKHITKMKKGSIDTYSYGDSGLTVSVEYCANYGKSKGSDKYFAFDNPKLKMITSGEWEIAIYPHSPMKIKPKNIDYIFYIKFDEFTLQGEIIEDGEECFIFIHNKTTPIRDKKGESLIFQQDYNYKNNYRRNILKPIDNISKFIYNQIYADNVYFQDNEIGEVFRNYLLWCEEESFLNK